MGIISASTFNPLLRQYVAVRLQQGVPIVDADWNEMDDIHSFEVRAFLKWFIGNGVPEGNDGFCIDGAGLEKDFWIRSGVTGVADALNNVVGRCIVNGMDVLIGEDIKFSAQPLHIDMPGSAQLAAKLGVPTASMSPLDGQILLVFLDVWEYLVMPEDEPSLILAGLGTPSCARIKREWVVRVRDGNSVPKPNEADYMPGHSYYALATIRCRKDDQDKLKMYTKDEDDLRERRLLLPPATLVEDTLGIDPTGYRRGQGRPAISLREAINALLRGGFPRTPEIAIAPLSPLMDWNGFLFDNDHGLVALWSSSQSGPKNQIVASRLDLRDTTAGFAAPQQITSDVSHFHGQPNAALLPNGDLLVAYIKADNLNASNRGIFYKRASITGLNTASEQAVTPNMGQYYQPFVFVTGDLVTFFYYDASTKSWQLRRFQHTTSTFVDTVSRPLPGVAEFFFTFHAVPRKNGDIWIAITTHEGDHYKLDTLQFTPSTDNISNVTTLGESIRALPAFVLCRSNGDVQVFWTRVKQESGVEKSEVYCATYTSGHWQNAQAIPNTVNAKLSCAVEDANSAIWLFCGGEQEVPNIFFMSNDPITKEWGQPRQMTFPPNAQYDGSFLLSALAAPDNTAWVFWSRSRLGAPGWLSTLYYTRLITSL